MIRSSAQILAVPSRRRFLGACAGTIALIAALARQARADVEPIPDNVRDVLRSKFGAGLLQRGRIEIDLPVIAETGWSVPIGYRVEMPEQGYVRRILAFAPGNPELLIGDYLPGPRAGRVEISTRIRLARTQTVVAAAQLSDRSQWVTTFKIVVTLGACIEDVFEQDWKADRERRARREAADRAAAD